MKKGKELIFICPKCKKKCLPETKNNKLVCENCNECFDLKLNLLEHIKIRSDNEFK